MAELRNCSKPGRTARGISSRAISPFLWVPTRCVWYSCLSFATEEDKKKLSKVMEKLDEFAIGEVNETYERYVFNSRDQEADESIDAYVAALRKSALTCNLCSCLHDSIIRDKIVLGVRSKQLRKRLLQERKRALSKCIDICRSMEASSDFWN